MSIECKQRNVKLVLLYVISVAVRFFLGSFYPRTINCYPDELLYLSAAESLWNHHNIQVFNVASSFEKIGYSLVIAPAFAVANVKIRGTIVAFINAGVISLGVFPVYGLAQRILEETKHIWLCVYLYLIAPSLTYSMTYMSEVLSIPLSLYLLYEVFVFEEKESTKKKVWAGCRIVALLFLNYIVKSVSLVFVVALLLVKITEWLWKKEWRTWKKVLLILFGVLGATGCLYVFDYIYLTGEISSREFLYTLWGSLFFCVITVLGFGVLPVLLPVISCKDIDMRTRNFFSLVIYMILVTAVVVSAMIYIVEDFPSVTPRAHLRYVEFLFVPIVIVFLRVLEKRTETVSGKINIAVVSVWAILQMVVFCGFSGQTIDQTMLFYWQLIAESGKIFSATKVRLCSAVIVVVVVGLIMIYNRNKEMFEKIFLAGLIMLCLGNSVLSIFVQYKTHTHTSQQAEEMEQLLDFVREHASETFLVMKAESYNEMVDTSLIDCDNVWMGLEIGPTQIEEKRIVPKDFQYVVVSNQQQDMSEPGEPIADYPNLGCVLYRLESSKLYNK